MQLTLGDVIAQRHLLSPREAAALTLAVGREWDRQRARQGNCPLPDPAHIQLTSTGDICFAQLSSDTPADSNLTLSALLGHFLGLDEQRAPGHQIPGGLLITIAGRLGPMDLPSAQEDGFRSALRRFADDDPGVLAQVFDRVSQALAAERREAGTGASDTVRRGPDRRRQPPVVATLRRAVRDLERQTFEAKIAPRTGAPAALHAGPRHTTVAAMTAAAALILSVAGFFVGAASSPGSTSAPRFEPVTTATPLAETPTLASASTVPRVANVVSRVTPASTTRRHIASTIDRSRPRVQPAKKADGKQTTPFVGGSRAITWAQPTR